MSSSKIRTLLLGVVVCCVAFAPAASLGQGVEPERKSAGPAVTDALIVRPMMVARTLFGLGTFLVSLPFTAPGNNVEEAYEVLVAQPARDTFLRPLGEGR